MRMLARGNDNAPMTRADPPPQQPTASAPVSWPGSAVELEAEQERLANIVVAPWRPSTAEPLVAGVFVAFQRGLEAAGSADDLAWAATVAVRGRSTVAGAVVVTRAAAPYRPGHLALREGPVLEAAVRALGEIPDVLLVNATGRDHPRRAGLALHLGAVLGLPTIGVTDRPLVAVGAEPGPSRGDSAPLRVDGELVGYAFRTRTGVRPICVHAAWRTDAETAVELVRALPGRDRTPEPLRLARREARVARHRSSGTP